MPQTTHRLGLRTTQTVNPQDLLPDVDEVLRRSDPTLSQLSTLLDKLPSGKKPRTKRIDVRQYRSRDALDQVTAVTLGTSGNSELRYARLTVAQRSNLATTPTNMIYQPGDRLFLIDINQAVEVVATPTQTLSGFNATLSAALVGNGTQNPNPGNIIVRNIQPVAINQNYTGGWMQFGGYAIYEGQPVSNQAVQRDVVYDYNFVEHVEKVMKCTEDETEFIIQRGNAKDMQFQREETLIEIKEDVEKAYMFGKRAFDQTVAAQPKHHMGGILDFIKTNQMVYNPAAANLNYEQLIRTWMTNQVFRWCPNGMRKLVLVGERLSDAFLATFDSYRRKDISGGKKTTVSGVDFTTYEFGGRTIDLVTYRHFRVETPSAWWAVALDLPNLETRIHTNYRIKDATLPNERVLTYAVDWIGSLAVHLEETHSWLRTA